MKKSILAIALAALTTTSAFANENFKIEGTPNGLVAGCSFLNVHDGSMTWDESTNTWTTSQDAQIRVKTRDVLSVEVTNDGNLRDSIGPVDQPSAIDYANSSVVTENTRNAGAVTSAVSEDAYTVTGLAGGNVLNIDVDHSVSATDSFVALNDVNYHVQNTATCNQ